MKKSTISFEVNLDEKNLAESITWKASDNENKALDTKAFAISLWDREQQNTLKIDLWTKEMRIDEMDKFLIDTLGGLSQTMLNATGDSFISQELNNLCDKLVKHVSEKKYD